MLGDLLKITIECGRGQQATAAIEGLIDYLEVGKKYLVFCITDYDYFGQLIMDSLVERAEKLGLDAEFVRIGVSPKQIPPNKLEQNKYLLKLDTSGEKAWASKFAIDGKYGLEIQALSGPELRSIIADAIYEYCQVNELYNLILKETRFGVPIRVADDLYKEHPEYIKLSKEYNSLQKELEQRIQELREALGINALEVRMYALRTKLYNKYLEEAEKILEQMDDREIPWEFLKDKIINGDKKLDYQKYTNTSLLEEKIKTKLRGDYGAE